MTVSPAGIYIHIPFCARKCTYCNFNTTDFSEDLSAVYTRAVEREIELWGRVLREQGRIGNRPNRQQTTPTGDSDAVKVDSIYFGGGTPSIIEAEQLSTLIEACKREFQLLPTAEITIEINPGTHSRQKMKAWLESGINRASVGVQSFIDRELISLSRTHTAEDARSTLEALRETGFSNISLDLIAGLPDQTLGDWAFNLREALALQAQHLSLYLLEVKEGTQLYAQIKREQRPLPSDDVAAKMYEMTCEAVRDAGYRHYEISNFARAREESGAEGFESKHNLKYWTGAPFYGMGCGAHSYDGRSRWTNTMQTLSYINQIEGEGSAVAFRRELSLEERAEEALFMWLRLTSGVSLSEFRQEYGLDALNLFGPELPRLREAGLMEIDGDRLALTDRGRLLSNEVFVALV